MWVEYWWNVGGILVECEWNACVPQAWSSGVSPERKKLVIGIIQGSEVLQQVCLLIILSYCREDAVIEAVDISPESTLKTDGSRTGLGSLDHLLIGQGDGELEFFVTNCVVVT